MRSLVFLFMCVFLAIPCEGRIITVDDDGPADFNNIQAAIDDANDGDEIVVADGTYTGDGNWRIEFLGKAITVRSENGPNSCIIDCQEGWDGFNFHGGETGDSVVDGFTITTAVAGIRCGEQSSPTIRNCTVRQSRHGIYCFEGSSPSVKDCTVSDNRGYGIAYSVFGRDDTITGEVSGCVISNNGGGGVLSGAQGMLHVRECTISGNRSEDRYGYGSGGILCMYGGLTVAGCNIVGNNGGGISCGGESLYVSDSIIRGNSAGEREGAGIWCESMVEVSNCSIVENTGGLSGGIFCGGGLTIADCTISNNSAIVQNGTGWSGGIFCAGGSTIADCTISNNSAQDVGGILCAHEVTITNSVISGNSAKAVGGIGYFGLDFTLANCTITANIGGESFGGGFWCYGEGGSVTINNCVLWDNESPQGHEMYLAGYGNTSVSYTNILGGPNDVYVEPGVILNWHQGNIKADPCFIDPGYWADANDVNIIVEPNDANAVWAGGDYHLLPWSPCIDAGDPNYAPGPNDIDLDGNPRVVDGDEDGNSVVDMGAYEFVIAGPVEMLAELGEMVEGLGLNKGTENSLLAKLEAGIGVLEDDNEKNDGAAVNILGAFINAASTQSGKKITEADADALIAEAVAIIEAIGSG